MLNKNLDLDALKQAFSEKNRITIRNVLDTEVAEKVLASLKSDIPWQLAYMEKGVTSLFSAEKLANMSAEQLNTIYQKIAKLGADHFQFCYHHYSVSNKNFEYCAEDAYINTFKAFLESDDYFNFSRAVTGFDEIKNIEIQTARYTANNYLMMHNDSANSDRRVAYVLNLSKNWHVDWGGLLHFIDENGQVTETFVPTFNSLTFFSVPAWHKVSYVMPFVTESRYSVTGWLNI